MGVKRGWCLFQLKEMTCISLRNFEVVLRLFLYLLHMLLGLGKDKNIVIFLASAKFRCPEFNRGDVPLLSISIPNDEKLI